MSEMEKKISINRPWPSFRALVLIITVFSLLGVTYKDSRDLGMAETLPLHSFARALMSIGISISKLTYGAEGYLLYVPVVDALIKNGFRDDQISQPGRINYAIEAARVQKFDRERVLSHKDWGDDKGYSDFTTLAFRLFGFQIEALFNFYFLLMGIAITAFILRFYSDPQALLVLVAFLAAHLMVVRILPNSEVNSVVHDARFLPAISCIAMLHWMLAMIRPARRFLNEMLLLVVQMTILIFILNCRSSSIWQIIAIGAVIVGVLLFSRRIGVQLRWRWLLSASGILVAGVIGLNIYKANIYDKQYLSANGTQSHAVWHNVYMGLGFHPDAISKYDLLPDDSTIYKHAYRYLATNEEAVNRLGIAGTKYYEPVFIPLGWGGYDRVVKQMFFDFSRRDPKYVAEVFLIYKPLLLFEVIAWQVGVKKEFPTWVKMNPVHGPAGDLRLQFFSFVVVLAVLLAFLVNRGALARKKMTPTFFVVGLGAAFSLVPSMVVGPFYYELPVVFIMFVMILIIAIAVLSDAVLALILGN